MSTKFCYHEYKWNIFKMDLAKIEQQSTKLGINVLSTSRIGLLPLGAGVRIRAKCPDSLLSSRGLYRDVSSTQYPSNSTSNQ